MQPLKIVQNIVVIWKTMMGKGKCGFGTDGTFKIFIQELCTFSVSFPEKGNENP